MKNVLKSILCTAFAVLATGCATVSTTSRGALDGIKINGTEGKPSEVVFLESSSAYIFWSLPLCSGDIKWNDEKKCLEPGFHMFKDNLSLASMQNTLISYADNRNCDLVDIIYNNSCASYADASETGLIGALFSSATINVSAVLVPRNSDKEEK